MCKYKQKKRVNNYFSYGTKSDSENDNIFRDPRYFIQVTKKNQETNFYNNKKGKKWKK